MSLQVWLPLNGDLRNNGLCNCKTRNINAIYNSDEWCYNFHEYNSCILLHNPPILDGALSFSFWLKYDFNNSTSSTWHYIYSGRKANDKNFAIIINNKKIMFSDKCTFNYTFNTESSVWTNIVITYTGTTAKLYVNGELKNTISNLSTTNTNDVTIEYASIGSRSDNNDIINSSLRGSLRDFRIYDHCLSVKEIKELSKGLILHYPFNNNGLGYCNPNLLINSAPDNITSQWYAYNTSEQTIYNSFSPSGKVIRFKVKNDNINYYDSRGVYMSITSAVKNLIINDGGVYTLSAYIRSTKPLKISFKSELMINNNNVIELSAQWKLFSFSSLINTNSTRFANTFYASFRSEEEYANITEDDYVEICMVKLEKGDKATTWIPNEADPEYIDSLLDTSIVNDTSGFGTYGIVNGDLSYDIDSPIYRASIKSEADGNYIQGAKTLPNFDNMTLSVWVYPTKSNGYAIFSDRKSNLAIGLLNSSAYPEIIVGTSNFGGNIPGKILPTTYNINNWHHIVLVKTASNTFDLYIDNVLTTNSSNKSAFTQDSDYFQIMHRLRNADTDSAYFYQGKLSDLRIYTTALSEDDIKELYESKISVDKDGNVYIKDIIEE